LVSPRENVAMIREALAVTVRAACGTLVMAARFLWLSSNDHLLGSGPLAVCAWRSYSRVAEAVE
jgi:hypothetical protein